MERPGGRLVELPAVVLLALSLVASAPASGGAAGRDHGAPGTTSMQAAARGVVGIHTWDRQAVNRAYLRRVAPNLAVRVRWTGSNRGCRAGSPSRHSQAATLASLNFVRALGHLGGVTFDRTLSLKAQRAALIMSANNSLSHLPPRRWKCWTRSGFDAAMHSNLALAYPRLTAGATILGYMTDAGDSNAAAGHRRWLMYPYTTQMGNGATRHTNALWVLSTNDTSQPDPNFVGWPTAGWFPAPLEPAGRWSLSASNESTNFIGARVSVINGAGMRFRVHVYPVVIGYGKPTLVWHVGGIKAMGHYHVTVRNIRTTTHPLGFTHSYTVRMFRPWRG